MKRLRTKIMVSILASIACVSLVLGFLSTQVATIVTENTIKNILSSTASVAARSAQNKMSMYTYTVGEIASAPILSDDAASIEDKRAFLDSKVQAYYMRGVGLADASGNDLFTGESVASEEFFRAAAAGKIYFSTPYISSDKTDMHVVVSAPVMKGDAVSQVVYFLCDANILMQIIEDITIGKNGDAYILDREGYTIAYQDPSLVLNHANAIAESKANPSDKDLKDLADIETAMVNGETGIGRYMYGDIDTLQCYAPVPGSDGWSIGICVSRSEFMTPAIHGSMLLVILSVVFCVIGLIAAIAIGQSIAKPVAACAQRLALLAQGDLDTPAPTVKGRDEIAVLSGSIAELLHGFHFMISDISDRLSRIAAGDLTAEENSVRYRGGFSQMQVSVEAINRDLQGVVGDILSTSEQVAADSAQVAAGAGSLSQSSMEQASSAQQLSASIAAIHDSSTRIAENSSNATEMSVAAREKLTEGIGRMSSLVDAMHAIESKADAISKIIKTIDDIAFQTNILALNASVEAARAGTAGSGFAVVAGEVRNLATKSAEAAKNTAILIEGSVESIKSGTELARITAATLNEVVDKAKTSSTYIAKISDETTEQVDALSSVNMGVEHIAELTQANSTTCQQSAALCEGLSAQAHALQRLVGRFKVQPRGFEHKESGSFLSM